MNFNFLLSVAVLFNDFLDTHFLYFEELDDFLRGVRCEAVTGEIFFQLEFSFGNVGHFLSFDLFPVLDNFVDFEEILLGMRTDLGTSPEGDLFLDFLPVFAEADNGWIRGEKYHLKI